MGVQNNLKKQIDLPVWEWCRFAPIVATLGYSMCSDESSGGRYIYYVGSFCYRYDTWSDGWQQIATHNATLSVLGATRYTIYGGFRGKVISGTTNTITIAGLQGQRFIGKKVRIYSGTGAGQERTITAMTSPTIYEHGVATAGSALIITDNQTIPKKWKINQWVGYQVRVVYGAGYTQTRKILYNDTNTLYVSDPNWQPYDSWNNTGFSAVAPFGVPAANTVYYIESTVVTVDTNWSTQPDATSRFVILSGAIWFLTSIALASGAVNLQYYDIISDTWINKTRSSGLMPILGTSDISIERTGEISGTFISGNTTSSDTRSMTDSGASWSLDRYANYQIRLNDPITGLEQRRRIIGNNVNTIYIEKPWNIIPTTAYTYSVYGDTNALWVVGNAQASIYKYMIEEDLWTSAQNYDSGVVMNMSVGKPGKMAYANSTTVVNTAAILSVNPLPTVPGTGYKIGDICTVSQSTLGKVRVTNTNPYNGAVLSVELFACGTGTYTPGTGKATTNTIPAAGGGAGLTIEITSVGSAARLTTAMAHDFIAGDTFIHTGATVAAWNGQFTILACDSVTWFDFIPPNNTAPVAVFLNSTTQIVDCGKNWTIDEFKGKEVTLTIGGLIPTAQIRKILSNNSTTLFVNTLNVAAGVNGTSRYVIHDLNHFGRAEQIKISNQDTDGWATSGTSTSLTDSTKNWFNGQWIGYRLKVICGSGFDKGELIITGNTATDLILVASGFTINSTTKYRIMDSYGTATGTFAATTLQDNTKNWPINHWAGRYIRLNVPAAACAIEVLISSNTANVLTYGTTTTICDANTTYTILSTIAKQIGIQAMWNYGETNLDVKGRYLYVPYGGTAVATGFPLIMRYVITEDRWDLYLNFNPQTEVATLGAQWCYDGKDRIYWTPSGAQATRVLSINLSTMTVDAASIHPYANGVAVQGNRMEIITTDDGLMYLYILRVTGAEFFRTLLWWN